MRVSRPWRCDRNGAKASAATDLLLSRWRTLSARAPAHSTQEALRLLEETAAVVTAPPADAQPSTIMADKLLGTRQSSMLIWKTLRRQRVPWEAAMAALSAPQLAAVPTEQARYIQGQARQRPWSFSRAVLASWDMRSADLVPIYQDLKKSTTLVQYAQLVTAALRSRPELQQVLPVPADALQQCYLLGSAEDAPSNAAATALRLCQHMELLGAEALSTHKKEQLAMSFAKLHGRNGDWDAALQTVQASHVVRLSAKTSFSTFVKNRQLWKREKLSPQRAITAISCAPHWHQALHVFHTRPTGEDDAAVALLSRPDIHAGLPWADALSLFAALPAHKQLYNIVSSILERVPVNDQYVKIAVGALGPVAARMYPSALARRIHSLSAQGKWADAIALSCASTCYDVAADLTRHLTREECAQQFEMPHELVTYEKTACFLQQPQLDGTESAEGVAAPPLESSPCIPAALAHALHGDWRRVAQLPVALSNKRLRSFLAAKALTEDGYSSDSVECHYFSDAKHTQLVASCASEENRRIFCRSIPSTLRPAACKPSPPPVAVTSTYTTTTPAKEMEEETNPLFEFLHGTHFITSRDEAETLFSAIAQRIRRVGRPHPSGVTVLHWIAQCCATGRIRLGYDAYSMGLGVLTVAAEMPHGRLDSFIAAKAFTTVPSTVIDSAPAALAAGVEGLMLLGESTRVTSTYTRWQEKVRTKVLEADPKGHTLREPLADTFSKLCYYTPHETALSFARRIWRDHRNPFSLIIQELLHGDARQAADVLREAAAPTRTTSAMKQRRRTMLSASFCLLNQEVSLRAVLQACGKSRVQASDLDAHGIQRLLKVLPADMAVNGLLQLDGSGETVDELWVCLVMVKPDLNPQALPTLAALQPYSHIVSCVHTACRGVLESNPRMALKSMLRYTSLMEGRISRHLLFSLALLMRAFCESKDMVSSLQTDANSTENQYMARGIYNRLLQVPELTEVMKRDRKVLTQLLREPEAVSPLLMLGYLHHVLCRTIQHPIPPSFSSHCLQVATTFTTDGMSALYFFKCIRTPNVSERCLLVRALRDAPNAMSSLLTTQRFVKGFPEQVVVWSDEATGPNRWLLSLQLLESAQESSEAKKASSVDGGKDLMNQIVVPIVSTWDWAQCERGMELLRRGTALPRKMTPDGAVPYHDDRTAEVLRLITARQQQCHPPTAADGDKDAGADAASRGWGKPL